MQTDKQGTKDRTDAALREEPSIKEGPCPRGLQLCEESMVHCWVSLLRGVVF